MPLGLGLASSHAPNMFVPPDLWELRYRQRTAHVPQPTAAAEETQEVIESYVHRIEAGFGVLREQLAAYAPDALIMVGDDQGEVFHQKKGMPTFALFMGAEAEGSLGLEFLGDRAPADGVKLRGSPDLAEYLAEQLIQRDFDLSCVRELFPIGQPKKGLGHAFTRPAPKVMPALDIPVIVLFVNCYYPPLPTAKRCFQLGNAIREALANRPERVAMFGSGGLSHDPIGPRVGWIDQPLDKFVLDSFASGQSENVLGLYTFDSDTMRGGTGEIRSWITVAGAFPGRKATIVDYIPAYHAITGLGFAYWPEPPP